MTELQLEPDADTALAAHHLRAARRVGRLADGVPAPDGGPGTAALLAVLGQVLATTGDLATANEATAAQVRAVGAALGATDASALRSFERLRGGS